MIESIIRRYNLFTPDEDFEETFYDTMSFLITKINNFDSSKNYKAYSYCGTICKNYLILKRTQYSKKYKNKSHMICCIQIMKVITEQIRTKRKTIRI